MSLIKATLAGIVKEVAEPAPVVEQAWCSACKVMHPASYFSPGRKRADGTSELFYICRKASRERQAARREQQRSMKKA